MNVFISWSGERSGQVAKLLHEWIQCVIQTSRPWISSEDIDKGSLWFNELSSKLDSTKTGIVCLTHANKNNPWILYEVGSLAKGISNCRVCTLLIDLEPKDLINPLAQFNHTTPSKRDMLKLIKSINGNLSQGGLEDVILQKAFDTYWPDFESRFKKIISDTKEVDVATPPITAKDLMGEVLSTMRSLDRRMSRMESEPQRRSFDRERFSPSAFRRELDLMKRAGISDEMIIERFQDGDVPISFIMRELERLEARKQTEIDFK